VLIHPGSAARVLLEVGDVDAGTLPAPLARYQDDLNTIVDWAKTYLSQPHEHLGRRGNVCPYVTTSMDRGQFYLSVYPGRPTDPAAVADALRPYRDWFLSIAPRERFSSQFSTILILFPDLAPHEVDLIIDSTQEALKSDYVEQGLMIGEFHNGPPNKAGLWNPDFLPLRSPVPLLAIRHMVASDFPFLRGERQHLLSYLRQFAPELPTYVREAFADGLAGPTEQPAADPLADPLDVTAISTTIATTVSGDRVEVSVQ